MGRSILDQIVAAKRREVERLRAATTAGALERAAAAAPPPRDFLAALRRPGPIRLIAEVKRASPSRGLIRPDFDPPAIARIYQRHGAACVSVLTDSPFFQGDLEHLRAVRRAASLPVLRKDFIIDELQVLEARAAGADAVLLIAECLDQPRLERLVELVCSLGMTPLVEFYEAKHAARVVDAGAELIGVNNRNLKTFQVDLEHTIRMRDRIPADRTLVGESGVASRADAERLERAGVDAMLVGERLMREPDIGAAVDRLLGRS